MYHLKREKKAKIAILFWIMIIWTCNKTKCSAYFKNLIIQYHFIVHLFRHSLKCKVMSLHYCNILQVIEKQQFIIIILKSQFILSVFSWIVIIIQRKWFLLLNLDPVTINRFYNFSITIIIKGYDFFSIIRNIRNANI